MSKRITVDQCVCWQWSTVMSITAFLNGQNNFADGIAVCIRLVCCCGRLCLCTKNNFFSRLTTLRRVINMPPPGFDLACFICEAGVITTMSLSFVP